ncbi:DoxX family membrane protein [Roseivivax marinus]|uniref:DoxX family membrane protein n=1 Tax=Roseivivax marinus TaxID=1379903 RepID=UPI00273E8E30|nr:DoxX family membrane protein [Roseivivax marinus]
MLHDLLFRPIDRRDLLLPLVARIVFAATLLGYFWTSALTKIGDGPLGLVRPASGAYAQIFPRQFEAAGYDAAQLGLHHWAVVVAGTWAEILLPLALVLGLFTRLAAIGMAGFVVVQSLTDLYGHGVIAHAETVGAWFDHVPDAAILDQRAFWMLLFAILAVKGGGALSVDRGLARVADPRPATRTA